MSTRACYRFIPENGPNDWPGVITVYKHSDGSPESAAEWIEAALEYAWPLPRYENDDFAAAFVAANKGLIQYYDRKAREAEAAGDEHNTQRHRESLAEYRTGKMKDYRGGGVRLIPFEGMNAHARYASDARYLYDIRVVDGKLRVTAYTPVERDKKWWVTKFFEGSTKQLKRATAPDSDRSATEPPDFELP